MKKFIIGFWILLLFSMLYLPRMDLFKPRGKTIHVFTWADLYDINKVKEFEEKTGIKVKLSFFTSNEELLIKLKSDSGGSYDLITPSDYAIKVLIDQGSLLALDKSRLPPMSDYYPFLINKDFDPKNRYSIPAFWEVYGIGYYKYLESKFPKDGYEAIFENNDLNYKISMVPDPIEIFCLASFHLFKEVKSITKEELPKVIELLRNQKKWIEAYVDDRSKYLIGTKNIELALFKSSYFIQVAAEQEDLAFLLPKSGTFMTIENYAIPKNTKNIDAVYEFINYMQKPESLATHLNRAPMYPANPKALEYMDQSPLYYEILDESKAHKNLLFIRYLMPEQETRDAWVKVKSY